MPAHTPNLFLLQDLEDSGRTEAARGQRSERAAHRRRLAQDFRSQA